MLIDGGKEQKKEVSPMERSMRTYERELNSLHANITDLYKKLAGYVTPKEEDMANETNKDNCKQESIVVENFKVLNEGLENANIKLLKLYDDLEV